MSGVSGQTGLRWWEEIRPQIAVIAFFGVLLLALSLQNRVTDADFWWHLRTGQWILEEGRIPRVDDYSYTARGQDWLAHSWLADVGMYALYHYVGDFSLPLLRSLLHMAAFGVLLKLVWERWPRLWGALGLVLVAFVASAKFWLTRPNSISLALSIGLIYLWDRYKQRDRVPLWLIPLMVVLWANLHSGWIYGLGLLGLLWLGEGLVGRFWPDPDPLEQNRWLRLGTFILISIPLVLINPYGVHLLVYPFRYFFGGITLHTHYIGEWLSPDFHQASDMLFALLLLLLVGSLAWRRKGIGPGETLVVLVFTALSLRSVRAAGIAIPLIAWSIAGAMGQEEAPRTSSSRRGAWPQPSRSIVWMWHGITLLIVLFMLAFVGWDFAQWGATSGFLSEDQDLRQAAAVLQGLPQDARMFNSYNLGGYLIWKLYPERRVFIDGRADLYGDEIFAEYLKVWQADPAWEEILNQYQVQIAICERQTPLATLLLESAAWDPVYLNTTTALFQRAP